MNCADGGAPMTSLVQATDGNFYGTAGGGTNCPPTGCGIVFKISGSGTLTSLYNFCSQPNCADGDAPGASLVQAPDGNFYGTTASGGIENGQCEFGCGTVFKITPTGILTTLYKFCSQPNCTDGAYPEASLVLGSDGNFYGTTSAGGSDSLYLSGAGTVFKMTPTGTVTTLYSFCSQGTCSDGAGPNGLMEGTDGNFYGTTYVGGANGNSGTVFKITPRGALTTLYSFGSLPDGADGYLPSGGVVQGTDGNFYGTTSSGGTGLDTTAGTIFKITPSGMLTTLYSFCSQLVCPDGSYPYAGLVQGTDGKFYGTTFEGGNNTYCVLGCGTVFKITSGGVLTTLYSFGSLPNDADGDYPHSGLVQATNGNFYGTTQDGGANGEGGTVFSLTGPNPNPLQLVPFTPCRLVDTRQTGQPIQGGTWQAFAIPQLGNCNIPATAAAYSLNVTVVPQASLGYLTIWPTGQNQPVVSTMNSLDGRIKANAAIVPAGANSNISVFASNTTNLVLDIDGYFAPASGQTLQFYPLTPCRVLDTRNSNGDLGGPYLRSGVERDFPVLRE